MKEEDRPDPDALLARLHTEDHAARTGRLSLFLGMCPGVGKTYAMLQAGRQRMKEGLIVLAGVVETHGRAETAALLEGMDRLPLRHIGPPGASRQEFDLDAVLALRPDLVLVDELAHTNAPHSRHAKRYQDVLELLDAGIDVLTTLNVQHIESQVDTVRQITGVTVHERVPDSLLDRAREIQLVDISVEKLLERLRGGKVYLGERADTAAAHFFREGNLTALREMALRFTAEQVDRDLEDIRRAKRVSSAWKTNARLLVGVGPSPYAESLIRWTRRAATRLGCPWLVVWVETARALSPADQDRLAASLALARKLGAEVVTVTGENLAGALLTVARERNVSQIVVGKPDRRRWWRRSLADRLIDESGDIDICAVRPLAGTVAAKPRAAAAPLDDTPAPAVNGYSVAVMLTFVLVSLGLGVLPYTGYMFVGLGFLIAVTLTGLWLARGPVLLMATLCALSWNFFYIEPRFTFYIGKPQDIFLFVMFFTVACSMGHLTTRLRQRELAETRRSKLTAALLRVTQSAALATDSTKGLTEAVATINELLRGETCLVARREDHTLDTAAHPSSTFSPAAKEWGVAGWAFQHKQAAGRFTDTLPQSSATWFPLQTATAVMGVMGIRLTTGGMDFGKRQAIEAFALQLALVLEKDHFLQAVTHVEMLTQSERLQRALLDSVSHELKTPLAVIQASLEGLADFKNPYLDEILTANKRLQRVVTNLLQMTRIESAAVQPRREWCLLSDVLHQALEAVEDSLAGHSVTWHVPDDLPALDLDAVLLSQAVTNILHNAAVYTPPGANIVIRAELMEKDSTLRICISDSGPGLPDGTAEKVFDKFYRSPGSPAGGTGLGLSIARALIRSLKGDITAGNRPGGGAEFVITLPVKTLSVRITVPATTARQAKTQM